ncbi:MAG: hypothetical protein JWR08_2115 [Enterovirga sp.]|jgi:hypothetical protein|nr:hypothetical protein [Enterovirga sp.]
MARIRVVICHDCRTTLSKDEREHYGYQCHRCVVVEHELIGLAGRDPDHPDVARLGLSAVDLSVATRQAGSPQGRDAA